MKKRIFFMGLLLCGVTTYSQKKDEANPKDTEVYKPIPPVVEPYSKNGVPSDAIVLFDGTSIEEWETSTDKSKPTWKLNTQEKCMTVYKGASKKNATIQTKRKFGSMQLHIEWKSPTKIVKSGQGRGNSGVFLQGRYEIQILDNNNNDDTYVNGQVGSVYKQSVPLAKALVPTGEWNTYDIIYHAPEFKGDELVKPATLTLLHNGVLIQDHFVLKGPTKYRGIPKYTSHGKAPIKLQDHGSPVSYRNIWVREID